MEGEEGGSKVRAPTAIWSGSLARKSVTSDLPTVRASEEERLRLAVLDVRGLVIGYLRPHPSTALSAVQFTTSSYFIKLQSDQSRPALP